MRAAAAVAFVLASALASCAGGSNFSQDKKKDKDDRPAAEKDENASAAPAVPVSEPDADADQADKPVQITGTYLTCGEVEPPLADKAVVGCKLARQGTDEAVELGAVATSWSWEYSAPNGTQGSIKVKEQPAGSEWQVHYELAAATHEQLEKLIGSLRVVLDLVLRPGAGGSGGVKQAVSELLQVLLGGAQVVVPPANPPPANPPVPVPPQGPAPGPGPGPGPAPGPGPNPNPGPNPSPSPGPGPNPGPGPTPGPAPGPTPGPAPGPGSEVVPSPPPIVFFKLAPQGAGRFGLLVALSDVTGISDLEVSGGGPVTLKSAAVDASGQATLDWSVPVSVRLKRGTLTCTGSGAIGPSALELVTSCQ